MKKTIMTISIYPDPDLRNEIVNTAERRNLALSSLLRYIITEYIDYQVINKLKIYRWKANKENIIRIKLDEENYKKIKEISIERKEALNNIILSIVKNYLSEKKE